MQSHTQSIAVNIRWLIANVSYLRMHVKCRNNFGFLRGCRLGEGRRYR